MPGKAERHARSKEEWDAPGSRSAEVRDAAQDDPDPARRAPGKKNTRRWCRGKPGVEHRRVIVLHSPYGHKCGWRETGHWVYTGPLLPRGVPVPRRWLWSQRKNREWAVTDKRWVCHHEIQCLTCQKFLGPALKCPDREVTV